MHKRLARILLRKVYNRGMTFIRRTFHCSENKFFAVLFSALALGITAAWMVYLIIVSGAGFFTIGNIWHFFVVFLIYGCLFVYNIRNDNRAYTAIFMLLFACIVGSSIDLIMGMVALFQAGLSISSLLSLPIFGFEALIVVMGIFAFLQLNRYRIRRSSDYKKVRLFLILFAASVALPSIATSFIYLGRGIFEPNWLLLATGLAAEAADLCAAVASVFTFNRLIR